MDEKTIPREIQESGNAPLPLSKKSAERDMRLQFWIPSAIHRQLSDEAVKNGMTLATWTAYVLAKRPERVVERKVISAETKAKLDELPKIPRLETKVAELTRDRAAMAAERDALKGKLATLQKRIGTGKYSVKCPACKEQVELDLSTELLPAKPK